MSPKPDVSEQRRSQILDAATRVFSRQGFEKARMDDIVEESSLSKGALYWYFKSKDDIIFAIMDRIFDLEFGEAFRKTDPNSSATRQLMQMTDVIVKDLERMMPIMPLFYDFFALGLRNKNARKYMGAYLRRFVDQIIPIVERGIANEEFRQVDTIEATLALGAIMEGTILLWTYDSERVDMSKQIVAGMKLLLEGLRIEKDSQEL